jgi:hypothetical protein
MVPEIGHLAKVITLIQTIKQELTILYKCLDMKKGIESEKK